ncbi:phage distal tail protein [Streptomyces zhihengii]
MPILVQPVIPGPPPWEWPQRLQEMPSISYTDPGGQVTQFTDWERGWTVPPGPRGMDMPTWAISRDESPGIDGYALRQVRAQGKNIVIPIAFWAQDSRDAYLERRRGLIRSLNPKRGPGTLTLTQPNGDQRTIQAIYEDGLEGDETRDAAGARWCQTAITFSCPSPFWLGSEISRTWQTESGEEFYPILPLVVGASQVLGEVTVNNSGDDDAYPIWTIDGPATAITLDNHTTGETLTLTRTLTGADTVVIDTRQRQQTALLNGSTNLWPDLSDDSSMWALAPNTNELELTVSGSTSDTRIRMTYQLRYLAA